MSWLSDRTGIHLGNVGAPIGAAIGSIVPGVGTAIGAALGQGLGALGSGKNIGQAAAEGAGAYGVGKIASSIPGVAGITDAIKGKLANIPGASAVGGWLQDHLPGLASGGASAAGGGAAGGGGVNPLILALAGLQTANAASLGKKANDYSDQAFNLANDSYTSRAGLRSAGLNGLLHPSSPDLSSLAAIRAQNPVAATAGIGAAPHSPTPPTPQPSPLAMAGLPTELAPSPQSPPAAPFSGLLHPRSAPGATAGQGRSRLMPALHPTDRGQMMPADRGMFLA